MPVFDTHGHLNLDPLCNNWQQHWQKAQDYQIKHIFIPGTTLETSQTALDIASKNENLFAGAGIHPSEAAEINITDQLESLESLLKENRDTIIGLGEAGLDYYWLPNDETRSTIINKQQELFLGQILLAKKYQLPISIHVRDKKSPSKPMSDNAYWDTLKTISENHDNNFSWILHCASGPIEYIHEALAIGAYISFAGNITYPNATDLRAILEIVPKNKLLVETDAPYLPPQEFRGKICEPWMISHTTTFIEKQKNITKEELWDNAQTIFNLL